MLNLALHEVKHFLSVKPTVNIEVNRPARYDLCARRRLET
jgi:hypothetical protein